jgi:hypothetical protein
LAGVFFLAWRALGRRRQMTKDKKKTREGLFLQAWRVLGRRQEMTKDKKRDP